MRKIIVLAIVIIAIGCNYRHKKNYILTTTANTYNHNNGCPVKLYREYYRAFSSYMTSDLNALYLTDSTNFRINLGLYDTEYDRINTTCYGDTLKVEKITRGEGFEIDEANSRPDSVALRKIELKVEVEKRIYSLKKLKEEGDL